MTNAHEPVASRKAFTTRRQLLALGGIAGLSAATWYGWPFVRRLIPHSFAFEPMQWPEGFRRISAGKLWTGTGALVGFDDKQTALADRAVSWAKDDPCSALFGTEPQSPSRVPVAYFSDYRCPYCQVLSRHLIELDKHNVGKIAVTWHDWPVLGQTSTVMARAALAARRQGAYRYFHRVLLRTRFLPDDAYLSHLAEKSRINAGLLLTDMKSPEVSWELARSAALAGMLGFQGTPSLVVGRTAVSGGISTAQLDDLIEMEREAGPIPGCGPA